MKKLLIGLILSLFSPINFGQNNSIIQQLESRLNENPDSVKLVVQKNIISLTDSRKKIPLYHLLAKSYRSLDQADSAIQALNNEDSLLNNYSLNAQAKFDNRNLLADIYYETGQLTLAEKFYDEALEISKEIKDYKIKCNALLDCGWIAREQGRHAQALEYYFEAIRLAELNKDESLLANAYGKIAIVYNVKGDLKEARKYYYKSMDIYLSQNKMASVGSLYNNIGLMHDYAGDYDSAIYFFEKARHISDSLNDDRGVAIANENIGLMYYQKKENLNEGLLMLNNSLSFWRSENDIYGQSQTLIYMVFIYRLQEKFQTAVDSSLRSLEMAKLAGARDVERQALEQLYLSYKDLNKYDKALEYYLLYDGLSDSLESMNTNAEIDKLALQHEFDSKQLQDSLALALQHEQEQAAIMLDVETGKFWNKLMLIILVTLALVAVLIFYLLKQQKKSAELVKSTNLILHAKNKEIIDSINYAKRIQNAILPPSSLIKNIFEDSFVLYKPKDIVAGDFYWYADTEINGEKIHFFAVADCTGHGVPGAMVSVVCNNALNRSVKEYGLTDPAEILNKTREIVISEFEKSNEEVKDGMDISLCSISLSTRTMKWAGANNPLWVIRATANADLTSPGLNEFMELKPDKQPIGKFSQSKPFTSHELQLSKGDQFYIFTDGFADQFGGVKNKKLKYSSLKKLILSVASMKASEQEKALHKFFDEWRGNLEQVDDVCIAGVRI